MADTVSVGVDGCRAGWFYCLSHADGRLAFGVSTTFAALLAGLPVGARVLVDIPIGLLESGEKERECDRLARRLLSPGRGASVFPTPCRQAVHAGDYARASMLNRRHLGRGLSRQSWNIAGRIREVDQVLRQGDCDVAVHEAHPELCFMGLAGEPLRESKKTRAGVQRRLALLERAMPGACRLVADAFLEHGGFDCARDDVIDAAVLLLAARRWSDCLGVPGEGPIDPEGLPMVIHYLRDCGNN